MPWSTLVRIWGVPVATNLGVLSETIWADSLATAPAPEPAALAQMAAELLRNPARLKALAEQGHQLYREQFAIEHTIAKLRATP
jgi:glycosyltransferase involved in cell wall biosynthesis